MKLARLIRISSILLFALLQLAVAGQPGPEQLLKGVYSKLARVKDYTVDAAIRADIPLIRVLPVNARIYFRQPDQLKVESKNIAIIPRQGFGDIAKILGNPDSYTAVITGQENIGKSLTQVVSLIPVADTGDLLLSKLWIDPAQKLVLKTQLTTRSNGTMLIEYVYGSQAANGLPDKIIFTVDMKKFNLPRILTSEANEPVKPKQQQEKAQKKGVIEVTFTNYRVNQGIKDSVFRQN